MPKIKRTEIFCTGCGGVVNARLTDGRETYPHRTNLKDVPYFICDHCKCYVGCHYKSDKKHRPLGAIPTPSLRRARSDLHKVIDPLWKEGLIHRHTLYCMIASRLGMIKQFHVGETRSCEEIRQIKIIVNEIKTELIRNEK
jgi:hypothetical protein